MSEHKELFEKLLEQSALVMAGMERLHGGVVNDGMNELKTLIDEARRSGVTFSEYVQYISIKFKVPVEVITDPFSEKVKTLWMRD